MSEDLGRAQVIRPRPRTTPVEFQKPSRALPQDLLREASRRLEIIALLLAGLWTSGVAIKHLLLALQTSDAPPFPRFDVLDWIAALTIVASLGLFYYIRKTQRNPRFVLDLGLAYLVLTAIAIAVM